jgi:hypothetical protein
MRNFQQNAVFSGLFRTASGSDNSPAPTAVSRNLFLYLTLARLSDHYPALLKMFDRTQAANTLS